MSFGGLFIGVNIGGFLNLNYYYLNYYYYNYIIIITALFNL